MTTAKQSVLESPPANQPGAGNRHESADQGHFGRSVTVWYDAACPLCVREIALMRRLDRHGRIVFVDVQGPGDCPLDRETLLARLHARDAEGNLVSGAAAFAAMWRAIPLLRPLGIAAQWRPLRMLLELGYRIFLRVRPRLQRLVIHMGLK